MTLLDEQTMLHAIAICEQVLSESHAAMMQQTPGSKKCCMMADISVGAVQCRNRLENALDASKMQAQQALLREGIRSAGIERERDEWKRLATDRNVVIGTLGQENEYLKARLAEREEERAPIPFQARTQEKST